MLRLAKYPLWQILPLIGESRRHPFEIGGRIITVGTDSVRLHLHKKQGHCVACFLRSEYFWLEVDVPKSHRRHNYGIETYNFEALSKRAHLNPYGIGMQGEEILMTMDHIVPRSKGGVKDEGNIQVLCTKCNCFKGNRHLTPAEILELRCSGNSAFADFVRRNKDLLELVQ